MAIIRLKDKIISGSGNKNYFSHVTAFDMSAVPISPVSPPGSPISGDTLTEIFDNTTANERVIMRWTYNGTSWDLVGHPAYSLVHFTYTSASTIDAGSPPATPATFDFVDNVDRFLTGDTLWEEFDNGYIHWTFDGTSWIMDFIREFETVAIPDTTEIKFNHSTTLDVSSLPTNPSSPPSSPIAGDTVLEYYDNLTGTEVASIQWEYNGSVWNKVGHVAYYNRKFADVIVADLSSGSPPSFPVNFNTSLATSYVPGDTIHEEYNNGYIHWTFDGTAWIMDFIREFSASGGSGIVTTLDHVATFNSTSVPTSPVSPPGTPTAGDVLIQTFNNTTGNQRVIMRWEYNGSIWVLNGNAEYNIRFFEESILSDLDPDALPATPNAPGTSSDYLDGDVLHEEYNNGYLRWVYGSGAWVLENGRIFTRANMASIEHVATFDTSAIPATPTAAPSTPELDDIHTEIYNNLTGTHRAIIRWEFNGTVWVKIGTIEYNNIHFNDDIDANLDEGSPPANPVNFNALLTTSYLPNDTLFENYNNGFINWLFNGTVWVLESLSEYPSVSGGSGLTTYLRHSTAFDLSAIPSSPSSPPGSPVDGDTATETFDNLSGTERVTIRWRYNGASWVQNGHVEYNPLVFSDEVIATLDTGALPANPVNFNALLSTTYIPGDTLHEEYTNGYIHWTFNGTAWVLDYAREIPVDTDTDTNTVTTFANITSFDANAVPTTPTSPPGSPTTGDTHIEAYDNTTGNQRVIMRWTYNGSIWVLNGDEEYNIRIFTDSIGSNLEEGSIPATPDTPGTSSNYVPGDLLWEEYNNGYIVWHRLANSWSQAFYRIIPPDTDTNTITTLGVVASFNMNAVPTSPTSPPGSPSTGDTYIEAYSNTTGTQRVIMRWTYNGVSWDLNGDEEYNTKVFYATVSSNLTAGALPGTPSTPGTSSDYVTGDILHEEYNNGYLEWKYNVSSWTLSASRVLSNSTYVIKATTSWDEDGTLPTAPENTPSTPIINDILIQSYDNGTRDNAVTRYWTYNGSSWVELTDGIHRFVQVFSNSPAVTMTYGVAPTASLAATTTSYVNGDILFEKYTNGYGLYKFNNGSWSLLNYGLEVGRLQDAADFLATLDGTTDGWAVVWDNDISKFTLANI